MLYSWLIRCAVPFAYATLLWRGLSDRSYWQGLGERLGFGRRLPTTSVWLHAVSLGEMAAAAPLLRALRARHPGVPLVVTTATPTGRARARALSDEADIRYLPYDTPGSVRRFLARTQPRAAIILETELWPNLLGECDRRGIPVLLASARLSAKSVTRYRRLGNLFRNVFTANLTIAAQTEADAQRFAAIGAVAVEVIGNVKFDVELDAEVVAKGSALRVAYGAARRVWIAGSTHAGEEQQVLDAHASLRVHYPDAVLLLAPRHRDRFEGVADLLKSRGVVFARRTRMTGGAGGAGGAEMAEVSVLLVDTVGELAVLYASADVAFVGGSLVPIGGHNLLEPAALGLPVLTGPSHSNSQEIAQLLLARGAALEVSSEAELSAALKRLLDDPPERRRMGQIGQEIVAANRGAVEKLLAIIEPRLRAY